MTRPDLYYAAAVAFWLAVLVCLLVAAVREIRLARVRRAMEGRE